MTLLPYGSRTGEGEAAGSGSCGGAPRRYCCCGEGDGEMPTPMLRPECWECCDGDGEGWPPR